MTVGFSGIGLGVLYMAFIAMFIIILMVTSVRLLLEKSSTQQSFRNLKTTRFFFANIFTVLFLFLVALILNLLKIECLFLDRAGLFPMLAALLSGYFVPFIALARFFKRAKQ